jgi:prevent-host-death family protein
MSKVTIHVAKTNLSRLIAEVEAGGEVVICRGATEVARLVPVAPSSGRGVREEQTGWNSSVPWDGKSPRTPGLLKGVIGPTPDEAFDPLGEEELALWENGRVFPEDGT